WIGIVERSINSPTLSVPRSWSIALFASAALLFLEIGREYLVVEDDFRLARFEYLKIGSIHASQPEPPAPLLSNLTAYVRFYRTTPSAALSDEDLEKMHTIVKRYPYGKLLYGYSAALCLKGHSEDATRMFFNIRRLFGEKAYKGFKEDIQDK